MRHTTSAYFNNFDLNTLEGINITNYSTRDLPARNLTSSKLARANKSLLTSAEYASKSVSITGFSGGNNWEEIVDNFDRLKGHVQDIEGIIGVKQGSKDIEYIGTLNGVSYEEFGQNIGFTLTFLCSNPIGRDASGSNLFEATNITTSTLTKTFTVGGSALAAPRFTFVLTSVTGGTNKSISLLNAATSKGIKITRNWTSGDILNINSDTMEVLVNGISIDFQGQFPTYLPGNRTLQYIDDFSNRNITLSAIYTRQYS